MALTKIGSGGIENVTNAANATFLTIDASEQITVASEGGAVTTSLQQGSAKCWANFTGVTTTASRDSFNVASLTDDGTGQTTIAFTSAMSNVNYTGSWYSNGSASGPALNQFANAFTGGFGARATANYGVYAYSSVAIDSYWNDSVIHGDLA